MHSHYGTISVEKHSPNRAYILAFKEMLTPNLVMFDIQSSFKVQLTHSVKTYFHFF